MKPCEGCSWPMVEGGICDRCGREDDEIPFSAIAVLLALTAIVLSVCLAIACAL